LEIEEVSAGKRITAGDIKLLPIMRTLVSCQNTDSGIVCSGSKKLVGIVAVSPEWRRAINAAGEDVPVSYYIEQVPEVRDLLQSM
jgi:hypothetical protein